MKKTLLCVVGPTAIGKTKLAIALATYFKTEIISADSRQFYKEMQIGTAVPSMEELKRVAHHFIQHKSIFEAYSVGDFEKDALQLLDLLFKETSIAIMVGGSGLYIDAVTKGLDKFPEADPKVRLALNEVYKEKGIQFLQEELKKQDAAYYERVDRGNPHRLIRALEVCIGSGQPYSSFLKKEPINRPFDTLMVGITADRELIYERINKRVDMMIKEGLLEEAKSIYKHKDLNALQTLGYRELFNYFDGDWSLDFAISEIKKNTRRFAKRQLTWFRKDENMLWVTYEETTAIIIDQIEKQLSNSA